MFHQDWMMRQIQMTAHCIAKMMFGKDVIAYEIADDEHMSQSDGLFRELERLIETRELGKAEDLLFEYLDPEDTRYLELATDFYQRLNALDDDALESADFVRDEIVSGLKEVMVLYGLPELME